MCTRELSSVLCDNLMDAGGGKEGLRGRGHMYKRGWSTSLTAETQHCKAIMLQLKIFYFKTNKEKETCTLMDTLFFFVTTGREVLLASSGEKLGGAAKHLTAQRKAPQQRISSPQHRQLRLRKPPCWRVTRVLAQLTRRALPPLPFFPLGFQDTTPVMSPPAALVCPPVTSVSPPQCPNF